MRGSDREAFVGTWHPARLSHNTGVLRELEELLTKPLPIIYQQSSLTREVPVDWRLANPSTRRAGRRIQGTTGLSV